MLAKALRDVSQKMIEIIRSQSQPISTKEQIQQIATISSQDDDIGLLIATAMDEVGENGTITIQEGSAVGVSYEIKKGMELNQ